MITKPSKMTATAALAAALSMIATPAAAVELPYIGSTNVGSAAVEVQTGEAREQNQRRRHHRRHRHRNRVDAGDVIAGVLVLGTIAAIAGSSRNRDRDRDRDYRDRDYRDRDYRDDRNEYDSRGMERAADMCVDQIERGSDEVDDISTARRTADGWRVAGTLESGESWSCWIDNDGRVRNVDIGAPSYSSEGNGDARYLASAETPAGNQWDDNAYARARANTSTAVDGEYVYRDEPRAAPVSNGPQPAYPGGPLPGEEDYDDVAQGGAVQGDGRYAASQTPDFRQTGN